MSDSSNTDMGPDGSSSDVSSHNTSGSDAQDTSSAHLMSKKCQNNGVHDSENSEESKEQESANESTKAKNDLLEYMTRTDGSVVCKLCGEILQSRTHWYRHKYKRHVIQPLNPTPLFQCEQCLVFFKSRKGYIGHLASRHSEVLTEPSPVITRTETESDPETLSLQTLANMKQETDPEQTLPKSSVQNHQAPAHRHAATKTSDSKKTSKGTKDHRNREDWEERRYQEEKLVADIIDRVKRECEAQGSGGGARRGYTRRTTVMHT
ncbi:hypothetical protein MSG28_000477 [Choristoneura fumiferana]|uniref:Uncharacterized protein n=2 Tax=Choristoneura fumiferana TaxID=7141 RepID=A0ACC0K0S2_CHOFU|nr:hypothetical protein MSG28_000477 [Choristoneura fumiferana]